MSTAIGQAGTLSDNTDVTGQAIQVTFDVPLTDPVVALMATDFGGNKFSLRVIEFQTNADGDATGFTFTMDEWVNHDGRHPRVEEINWLAIESGVHTLPDGRVIEAGYTDADSDGEDVTLAGDFTGTTPVVLTTVASNNEGLSANRGEVDSDPFNITSTGFTINLEEAESQDGVHGLETVGWIAVQPGNGDDSGSALTAGGIGSNWVNNVGLGDTFTDAITVGETQTQTPDDDTGNVIFRNQDNDEIDLRFEEDTSADGDTGNPGQIVGLVTFENGIILCFTPGTRIDTPLGPRPVEDLAVGDLVITRDHGPLPLRWVSSSTVNVARQVSDPRFMPIRVRKDALAPGVPARDIVVSPQHRFLLEGWKAELYAGNSEVLAPAVGLLNDFSVLRERPAGDTHYIHLLFDQHEIIRAEGAWTESLDPVALDKEAMTPATREALFAERPELRTLSARSSLTARPIITARQAALFC